MPFFTKEEALEIKTENLRRWLDEHLDDYLKDNIRVRGHVDIHKLAEDLIEQTCGGYDMSGLTSDFGGPMHGRLKTKKVNFGRMNLAGSITIRSTLGQTKAALYQSVATGLLPRANDPR
jgi:hypothetical protein